MGLHVRFDGEDDFGYALTLSLVDTDETTLWSRTPPTGSHDYWIQAELEPQRVLAWTWAGHAVAFDLSGNIISNVFAK